MSSVMAPGGGTPLTDNFCDWGFWPLPLDRVTDQKACPGSLKIYKIHGFPYTVLVEWQALMMTCDLKANWRQISINESILDSSKKNLNLILLFSLTYIFNFKCSTMLTSASRTFFPNWLAQFQYKYQCHKDDIYFESSAMQFLICMSNISPKSISSSCLAFSSSGWKFSCWPSKVCAQYSTLQSPLLFPVVKG